MLAGLYLYSPFVFIYVRLIAVRQEANDFESSVVVQELESAMRELESAMRELESAMRELESAMKSVLYGLLWNLFF